MIGIMAISAAEIAPIASAAAQAVLQVILIASAGAYMRLDKKGMKTISDISYRILLPSLMFSNVTNVVSVEALRRLYVVPLGAALGLCVGAVLSQLIAPLVGLGRNTKVLDDFTRTHFLLASTIGNHGYLPLILSPATILQGALHPPGTDLQAQVQTGNSYIALWILVINVVTWSSAAMLMRSVAEQQVREDEERAAKRAKRLRDKQRMSSHVSLLSVPTATGALPALAIAESSGTEKVQEGLLMDSSSSKRLNPDAGLTKSFLSWRQWYRTRLGLNPSLASSLAGATDFVTGVVTPPVFATFSGLIIGLIPPLKALLFVKRPSPSPVPVVGDTGTAAAGNVLGAAFNVTAIAVSNALRLCASSAAVTPDIPLGSSKAIVATAAATTAVLRSMSGMLYVCASGAMRPVDTAALTAAQWNGTIETTLMVSGPCCIALGSAPGLLSARLPPSIPAQDTLTAPLIAPLGPTVTSALQAFAAAIVPMVALNLGSHIVAGDDHGSASTTAGASSGGKASGAVAERRSSFTLAMFLQGIRGEMVASRRLDEDDCDEEEGAVPAPLPVIPIIRLRVLAGVGLIRLLLMPFAGIAYALAVTRLGLVARGDRTLMFILMLQNCTPPAMNLQLIADIMGSGGRSTARVIGVTYVCSVVTITVWISVFLALIRTGMFD